jgi:transcription antitermination factor NusG
MRVTYRRELKAKEELKERGIESFVPLRYTIKINGKGHKKVLAPIVSSLIFVHAQQNVIQETKRSMPYLQYITNKAHDKIVVPDAQMDHFIAACGTYNESLMFFDPSEINLTKGTRVRVIGGDFEGYEGIFVKVKGARDRRVVIAIQGIIAVAMATIHPDLIMPIDGVNLQSEL